MTTFSTDPAADSSEEWFDVVDEQDQVLRSAPRAEVHGCGLLHRAAHIWVFNQAGQLLVHKRTAHKEEEPLKWTSSAAGHLSAGESYEQAAERELQEELGLQAPLRFVHKITAGPEIGYEHTALFVCVSENQPQPDPGEIERCEYWEIPELLAWMTREPEQFTNPFRLLMAWFVQSQYWSEFTNS